MKVPLSLLKTKWNSLASLLIIGLSLRDRFVKSVVVSQEIAVLNRLKKILPFGLRLDIYRAFIAPHFNYCSESWHHCGKRGYTKLEKINEQALRFMTHDKSITYETLLKQLNLLSPLNQRILKMATGVYKAIHRYKVSRGIGELLHERSTNYYLRGKHILELPKVNTTAYGLKSWLYTAAKIWNALPDQFCFANNIKNLTSKMDFSNFKNFLLNCNIIM